MLSVAVLAVASVLPPDGLPFPACLFKAWTGLPCFACGATRTFVHHARGRFVEGLVLSPGASLLAIVAVVVSVVALARATVLQRRLHLETNESERIALRVGAVVALVAHWTWLVVHGA